MATRIFLRLVSLDTGTSSWCWRLSLMGCLVEGDDDSLNGGDGGEDGEEAERELEGEGRRAARDAGPQEADGEDDEPDFAGREADVGHALARREAEALGPGPGVADHERRGHRGGREGGREVERGDDAAPHDAHVDDRLAPAIERGVHERAGLADLAGRAGDHAVEH